MNLRHSSSRIPFKRRDAVARGFFAAVLGFVATCAPVSAQTTKTHILFIGNSYTYFNNLPKVLEKISEARKDGPFIETESIARGGATLKMHWEDGKALAAIRRGGWDYVVLQEQSTLGQGPMEAGVMQINDPAEYFEHVRKFDGEIRKAGAKTLIYATWARENYAEQQRPLDDAFLRIARELNVGLIPVASAWNLARIEAPALRLYLPDRSHPTGAGTYLAALVFYAAIAGRPLPPPISTIVGPDAETGQQTLLVSLPWSDAQALRMLAARTVPQEPLRPKPKQGAQGQ